MIYKQLMNNDNKLPDMPKGQRQVVLRKCLIVLLATLPALVFSGCASEGDTEQETAGAVKTVTVEEGTTPEPAETKDGPIALEDQKTVLAVGDAFSHLNSGEEGKLSVVAASNKLSMSGSVGIVVKNNSDKTMGSISVTAIARDDKGAMVASGGDQGFNPHIMRPGEISLGHVFFGGIRSLPKGATIEFEINGEPAEDQMYDNSVDFQVTEAKLQSQSSYGIKEKMIIGLVKNDTEDNSSGPNRVIAICFDPQGDLTSEYSSFAEKDRIPAEATSPFTINLYVIKGEALCSSFLIASGGYLE
jgi:hypothetical protein